MSYDKNMKDLMARLVAMSPEPPPYPDDIPLASQLKPQRSRPALAFAAAAALVVLLAVPLLLFTGGETPPAGTSTTLPPGSTVTVPPATTWSGVVFLFQSPENSVTGGDPALVPVAMSIQGPFGDDADFSRAMAALLGAGGELPPGLHTAIPSDVVVEGTTLEGTTIVADMSEAFLRGANPAGQLSDFTMLNQLIYSLTIESPDADVLFTVDGDPVEAFGTGGLVLTEPVNRESFIEQLHVINLTVPTLEQDDGTYLIEGVANTFEGTVTISVLDGDRTVVDEVFETTSCGTGCWGEFSTALDGDLIVPGESAIRVFTYSAEDDSVSEAVTVPIPEGDVWAYTIDS